MKTLLAVFFLLVVPSWGWLMRVHNYNMALVAAQAASRKGNAPLAAKAWNEAVATSSRSGPQPTLLLNLGHTYMSLGNAEAARENYGRLLSAPSSISSSARQQLGVLALAQGQNVVALSQLREALRLNPSNATARYNYETLRAFLDHQRPEQEAPEQCHGPSPRPPQPSAQDKHEANPSDQPNPKPGTGPKQDSPSKNQADPANPQQQVQPSLDGQKNAHDSGTGTGKNAPGQRQPGKGHPEDMPTGHQPGSQRGLDQQAETGQDAPDGASARPGSELARSNDMRLQTQRERLKALNLTPAQAQQVLEALREQEQQYLQQVSRPAPPHPDPSKPTW